MNIDKKLKGEIEDFCILNEIKETDQFILSLLKTGFNVEKYGNAPWKQEIEVEKIVEKEIIKEISVEKIVEVEKEVIKEVEKKVYITDDDKVKELTDELDDLRDSITTKEGEIVNNANNMRSLNNEIESKKGEITNLSDKLKKINEEMINLKKDNGDKDIYGDGDGGFWGSNLKDKK